MNPAPITAIPRALSRAAGLLFVIILGLAAAAAYFNHLHRVELKTHGTHIQATIVEMQRLGGKNKISYQFQVNEKTYLETRRSQLDLNPGDPIEVIYLPGDPEINDLASTLETD